LISFGVAPAFLVHRIVLRDVFPEHPELGWSSPRFTSSAAPSGCAVQCAVHAAGRQRQGICRLSHPLGGGPGGVADALHHVGGGKGFPKGKWRFLLPVLMLFLSWMMVSQVRYPSFKSLNLRATRPLPRRWWRFCLSAVWSFCGENPGVHSAAVFHAYLIYGFVRPRISRAWRREIEDEDEDEPDAAQ